MIAPRGNYVWKREEGGALSLVGSLPTLDPEREHRKFDRSTQRKQYDDRRWGAALANPWTPAAVMEFLRVRVTRRAKVIYARTRRAIWGVR